MMVSRMISKYFSLAECTRSAAAQRLGRDNQPPEKVWQRIKLLMTKVMDPIRELFGVPISPSSVYRSWALNGLVGGSPTSQHPGGEACDFQVPGYTPREVMRRIIAAGIPFDQLIDEFGQWVHISYTERRPNRGEILEYRRVNGKVRVRRLTREEG
jgi:zinc D-Ala-D-Ala carboxypeptidase